VSGLTRARRLLPGLVLLAAVVAGCSDDPPTDSADLPEPSTTTSTATSTATSPEATATPELTDLRTRCEESIPADAPLTETVLTGPQGLELRAGLFTAPEPDGTVLVLLHQTDGDALCGWGEFATLAAARGVSSIAIDMCGYGETVCSMDLLEEVALQVRVAARVAEADLSARRVVLVGASMGGSQTVRGMAQGAPADAWVDLSGPGEWLGDTLLDLADQISTPGMVVFTRTDGDEAYAAAKALARATGSRFLDGGSGHGWDLVTSADGTTLTSVGRAVLAFARGAA